MGKYRNKEKAAFWMADDDEGQCLHRDRFRAMNADIFKNVQHF